MKNNKILITHEQYYPLGGGIEQYIWGLNNYLTAAGYEVTILTGSEEGFPDKEKRKEGFVLRTPYLKGAIFDPQKVLNNWGKLVPIIQKLSPDIVYANNHSSLAIIKACQSLRIPVIYVCHGWGALCPYKVRFLKAPSEKLCMNERDVFTCLECRKGLGKWPSKRNKNELSHSKNFLQFARALFDILSPLSFLQLKTTPVHIRQVDQYHTFQKILNSADKIVSLSKMYAHFFPNDKTINIPLGIDTNVFKSQTSRDILKQLNIDTSYILVTSRIHHNKGQFVAVEALRYLPKNIKLVLAGNSSLFRGEKHEDNRHRQEIKMFIEKYQLKDRIIFTGLLNSQELTQLYSHAIATIVPSIWADPFPTVTLEAMACGCPVVITKNSGSSEAVLDEKTGYIIDRKDAQQIAQAVQKIIPVRKEMGKAARERIMSMYTWDVIGAQILTLLNKTYQIKK